MSKRILKITGSWINVEITYSPIIVLSMLLLLAILPICCVAASSFIMRVLFLFLFLLFLFFTSHVLFKGLSVTNTTIEQKNSKSESTKSASNKPVSEPKPSRKKTPKHTEPPMKKVPIPTEAVQEANDSAMDEWRSFMDPDT